MAAAAGWSIAQTCSMVQGQQTTSALTLVLLQAGSDSLVCIRNDPDQNSRRFASTYLGQGWQCSFVDVDNCTCKDKPGTWRFNRFTDFRKDLKERARGGVLFAAFADASLDPDTTTTVTICSIAEKVNDDDQFTVYAHKIVT